MGAEALGDGRLSKEDEEDSRCSVGVDGRSFGNTNARARAHTHIIISSSIIIIISATCTPDNVCVCVCVGVYSGDTSNGVYNSRWLHG